jgi:uncharacterized membrane protein YgaE (UPF0421/DUF939 family)
MVTDEAAAAPGLHDDVLTEFPPARNARVWLREAVDLLVGSDPGLSQLRMALLTVLSIGIGLGLAYLFVRLTGGLQLPAHSAPAPVLSAADHALLLVSMLLAGLVAMLAGFVVQEPALGGQALSSVLLPVPMAATLVLGLLAGPYRVPSLVFVVAALAVAVYLRRFGQRGFGAGMAVFFGAFLGFFLHTELGLRDAGWVFADLEVGVLASLLVRFAFFRPAPEGTLARMRRSQRARARRLLVLGVSVLTEDDQRRIPARGDRIRRQLVRLNETVLMIDAQLASAHPRTAAAEAQRSFDAELALSNTARFACALAEKGAPPVIRRGAAAVLSALLDGDPVTVSHAIAALRAVPPGQDDATMLIPRLAASAKDYAQARDRLGCPVSDEEIATAVGGDFTPAARLINGWLPGSVPVSAKASITPRRRLLDRATMPPYVRATIQIAVAGALAIVAGEAVSAYRLYWAVLTVFVCFMNVTNSGEEVRRALFRAGGTAIGIVLGDLLVRLTGGRVWASVLVVLVAMFFGIYLIRVNYLFMTIGITVMISQLYVQLGEFSWDLLLVRLAETTVGVGAVLVTVLVIVPLRPQRVLITGTLLWFQALRTLVEAVLDQLDGKREPLRPLVRQVDAAYASLVATATPLRRVTFGRTSTQIGRILAVSSAARQYTRSLAVMVEGATAAGNGLPGADDPALHVAAGQLRISLQAIEHRLATGEHGRYVRSSYLLAVALDRFRQQQSPFAKALQDLAALDGALARLATVVQMDVTEPGTARLSETLSGDGRGDSV